MDEMTGFEALGRHVAGVQDRELASTPSDPSRAPALVRAWKSRRSGPRRLKWASAVAVAALTGVSAAVWALHPVTAATPLRFSFGKDGAPGHVGALLATRSDESSTARFSDGSQFDLAPSTRARVQALRADGADLVIEGGAVRSSVVPASSHLWRVNAGPFTVLVTGTRFDTRWIPEADRFELSLYQGKVGIVGCGMEKELVIRAGETVRASCQPFRYEVTPNAADAERTWPNEAPAPESNIRPSRDGTSSGESSVTVAPSEETKPATPQRIGSVAPVSRPAPGPSAGSEETADGWRGLLREKRYGDAVAAAVAMGFEQECDRASAVDLKALADAAYFAGDGDRAATAYTAIRRRFAGSPQSLIAAYSLGRLEFDRRGAYDVASRWFRTYLTESPSGALAREALGRLMEAEQRSGDARAATETARQYLARYATGPHAELARRLTEAQ